MRVLITNITCRELSGTVTFTRDLALALRRLGHDVSVFSLAGAQFRDEMKAAGVTVSTRLSSLGRPDVIHGHHEPALMTALHCWPDVPAIWVCHDHLGRFDSTPRHPAIRRFFGVSRVCIQRLIDDGVDPEQAEFLFNAVDTTRFARRRPLSLRPDRAVVLSNYASEATHLPAVREACDRLSMTLTVAGLGSGRATSNPETLLGESDVVFAKGRAAIEALCSGAAVVLCDARGVGPLVTPGNLEELRPMNFGFEALTHSLSAGALLEQLDHYNPSEATAVSERMRQIASIDGLARQLEDVYEELANSPRARPPRGTGTGEALSMRERLLLRGLWLWWRMPVGIRHAVRRPAAPPRTGSAHAC